MIDADWRYMTGLYTGVPLILICIYYSSMDVEYEEFTRNEEMKTLIADAQNIEENHNTSIDKGERPKDRRISQGVYPLQITE